MDKPKWDLTAQLLEDLPSQFDNKPNIQALNEVLGEQLQQIYEFFTQLWEQRHFPQAEGKQLDGIGDIVVLSRMQALITAHLADMNVEMDDDMYRVMLAWKIFLNTSLTTYEEVHHLITLLWTASPMIYTEDPNWPATIIFDTPLISLESWPRLPDGQVDFRVLHITVKVKAGGVQLIIRLRIQHQLDEMPITVAVVNNHAIRHGTTASERNFDGESQTNLMVAVNTIHWVRHGSSPCEI
ncbi:MAG: DUF2612 domain-containing protein [Firmicutes bacterium]|nr:DUF2612 domain-containing protein [Bacillota bacterium]